MVHCREYGGCMQTDVAETQRLSQLGLPYNALWCSQTRWLKQQEFILSGSGERSLPGLQMATFLVCSPWWRESKEAS